MSANKEGTVSEHIVYILLYSQEHRYLFRIISAMLDTGFFCDFLQSVLRSLNYLYFIRIQQTLKFFQKTHDR